MKHHHGKSPATLGMAFAAIGIVFGDIGTSPMYAMHEALKTPGLQADDIAVLGVASLIFWTLTLIVSVKYLMFITLVDNDGEGGVFALAAVLKAPMPLDNLGRAMWPPGNPSTLDPFQMEASLSLWETPFLLNSKRSPSPLIPKLP